MSRKNPTPRIPLRVVAMLMLPALTLGGCGLGVFGPAEPGGEVPNHPPTTTGTRQTLTPRADRPLERLPVPIGFELDAEQSHRYHTDRGRVLVHVYKGNAPRDEVERFYRHVMPLLGWSYQSSQMVHGSVTLRFEMDDEWADVTIHDRRGLVPFPGCVVRAKIQTLASRPGRE